MDFRKNWLAWSLLILSVSAFPARAADPKARPDTPLKAVTVTATRVPETAWNVPTVVEVITAEQIQGSGASDLGDLLAKFVTGLVHKYTGLQTTVGLRGFRNEEVFGDDIKGRVLVLIDGHRVGTGNVAKLDLERIERVEVVKGPFSALYGSAAMGGVINVITRKGFDLGKFSAGAKAEGGSYGYWKALLTSGGRPSDHLAYHLVASSNESGDFRDPAFGEAYNTWERQKRLGGNLTLKGNENHSLRLGGSYADLTGGYPQTASWSSPYPPYTKGATQYYDKSHGYADGEYNGRFLEGLLGYKAVGYFLYDKNRWNDGQPQPDYTYTQSVDTTWGTDHQVSVRPVPWNTTIVGLNLEFLKKANQREVNRTPTTPYSPDLSYNTYSGYGQNLTSLWNDRVNIVLAGRYDYFTVKTEKPAQGGYLSFQEKSADFSHFSPKVGAAVKVWEDLVRLRGNAGVGFRSPSADQLSARYEYSSSGWNVRYWGNENLKPEKSYSFDLGADFSHPFGDLQLTYWYTQMDDYITTADTPVWHDGKPWTTWENRKGARLQGVDVNVNLRVSEWFAWRPSLVVSSRMTFNLEKQDEAQNNDVKYVSDYEIKSWATLGYQGLSSTLSYSLFGPQTIDNWDTYPSTRMVWTAFDYWDWNIAYRLNRSWRAEFNIYNLFDQRLEFVRGYLMPGRTFRLGVSYNFFL